MLGDDGAPVGTLRAAGAPRPVHRASPRRSIGEGAAQRHRHREALALWRTTGPGATARQRVAPITRAAGSIVE
jgi:hypothetical protein